MKPTFERATDSNSPDTEVTAHAEMYHRFMLGVKWMSIHLAVLLVFLVLWFCTTAGFLTALIAALVVLGAGIYAMTHGMAQSSENDNLQATQSRYR